ncbi:MAG: Tetratricopeptide 1 repeat-containing protein [Acidobacteriaceae bacterium]|nr:Tetratricopeptide 1 repeat-containing protein [Acidobacteriaceae bacterium]
MQTLGRVAFVVSFSLLAALTACNRDPNAQKQKYFESGNRYLENGQFPEAVIQFSNAIRIDPNFAAAHFKLAESYLQAKRPADAYRELQRTSELDPGNSKAALDLGLLLIAGRGYERVEPIAARMLKQDPHNADAHLLLSELNRVRGNLDSALQDIHTAIALKASDPQLYVQLASLQQAGEDNISAESSLRTALTVDPKYIPAIQALAVLDETMGKPSDAEQQLRYVIELNPKGVEPRRQLALLYNSQQRNLEAEQVMMQAKKDLAHDGDHYRVLGQYYNDVGDADKALAELASISEAHPEDVKTREDYIRLLLGHNQFERAARLNDAILKENPNDSGAQILRGSMLNSQGKSEQAVGILESAVKDASEDANGHYQLGLALSKTGYLERAEEEWRQATRLTPGMNEALFALADVARAKGDRELLSQTAEQLIQNNPLDPRGYVLRAESESASNHSATARADLMKAIQIAPVSPIGYSAMGSFLRTQGRNREAQEYYEKALECDAGNIESLAGVTSILMQEKQNNKAIDRVQAQVLKASASDAIYVLLGGLQVANRDMPGAEASLQKAVQLNPSNFDTLMLLAKVQMARGEVDQSLATAYKSIQTNPKNVDAYDFAGNMEELRGGSRQAEVLYRKALQIQPNNGQAANNLAYLLLQNGGNIDEALSLAQIARQKMPDSPSAADTLAWIYYRKGIYGMASNLLLEALQKSPDNATYHYHIGMIYQKQNNRQAARKHLKRALEISPNSPASDEIRRTLNQMS